MAPTTHTATAARSERPADLRTRLVDWGAGAEHYGL
jgi:hypothetical protein